MDDTRRFDLGDQLDAVMAKLTNDTKLIREGLEKVCAVVLRDHGVKVCTPTGDLDRESLKRFDLVVQASTPAMVQVESDPAVHKFGVEMPVEVLRYEGKPVAKLENWRIHVVEPYYAKVKLLSSCTFVRWTDPRDPILVVTVDGSQFCQGIADALQLGTVVILSERDRGYRESKPMGSFCVTPEQHQLAAMVLKRTGPSEFECQKDRRDDRTWHGCKIHVVSAERFEMDPRD